MVKQVQPLLSVRLLQNYLVKKTRKNKGVYFHGDFFKHLIIGATSGAAAAYFFTTEKGKAVKARIDEEIASFKEDPKNIKIKWWKKLADYKDLASILSKTIKQNLKMATSHG